MDKEEKMDTNEQVEYSVTIVDEDKVPVNINTISNSENNNSDKKKWILIGVTALIIFFAFVIMITWNGSEECFKNGAVQYSCQEIGNIVKTELDANNYKVTSYTDDDIYASMGGTEEGYSDIFCINDYNYSSDANNNEKDFLDILYFTVTSDGDLHAESNSAVKPSCVMLISEPGNEERLSEGQVNNTDVLLTAVASLYNESDRDDFKVQLLKSIAEAMTSLEDQEFSFNESFINVIFEYPNKTCVSIIPKN